MPESCPDQQRFVLHLGDLKQLLEPGKSYTLGKESSCDIRLGHGTVSPVHCRLEVTAEHVVVHDLNSLCGTKIADQSIMDQPWLPGQILEVGDIRIELETRIVRADPFAVTAVINPHRYEASFGEIMATELKRAPWFALSVLIHALILFVFWFFSDVEIPLGSDSTVLGLEQQAETHDDYAEDEITEEVENEEEMEDEEFVESELEEEEEMAFVDDDDLAVTDTGVTDVSDLMTKITSGSGLNDILKEGRKSLSSKFKKTVTGLRKNGLEIVFVFDSTGSMGTVLQAAKDRIAKMAGVLLELVPYAKIGVITYRDSGGTETYLTRDVALSRDFYRAINFMQTVTAGGGGDEPEAVYLALRGAVRQKWGKSSRRMVILIGDAPPHKHTEGKISSMVKSFSHNGRSSVHAIVTRPSSATEITKLTTKSFKRIARDGRGEALEFEDEGKILRAIMTLAFGKRESRSLEEVYKLAEKRNQRSSKNSQQLAEGKDLKKIRRAFQKSVISHDLVKAILKNPRPQVLDALIDFISQNSFNNPGKQAASYILQRLFKLDEPPLDPETCRAISKRRARSLRRRVDQLYR